MINKHGYKVKAMLADGVIKDYTVISDDISEFMQKVYATIQEKTGDKILWVEDIQPISYMLGNFPNLVEIGKGAIEELRRNN